MNLNQLISSTSQLLNKHQVIGLQSSIYPLLFLKKLREYLQIKTGLETVAIDMNIADPVQIKSQLEMSFLGQRNLYWLGDISQLSLKGYAKWITYLSSYSGPHLIVFFTTKAIKSIEIVLLPEQIGFQFYKQLLSLWLVGKQDSSVQFASQYSAASRQTQDEQVVYNAELIFKTVGTIPFDQAVRITDYGLVLGSGRKAFIQSWLESVIKSETSLFKLSGALFAGDKKGFLQQWKLMRRQYEFPFWLAYFSEQFFRAYHYIQYRQQNSLVEAKKIGFKLPFSFLQRDWRKYESNVLLQAHQRVYELDFQLKNGGSDLILNSFFLMFFNIKKSKL